MHDQNIIDFAGAEVLPDRTRRTASVFVEAQKVKLPALTMMGTITGTGMVTACDLNATDGSQVPRGLLYGEAEPLMGRSMGGLYVRGTFDPAEIALVKGWTVEAATAALAKVGIVLRSKRAVHRVHNVMGAALEL